MFERILVPHDGSQLADLALLYARAIAQGQAAKIILAQMTDAPTMARDKAALRPPKKAQLRALACTEGRVAVFDGCGYSTTVEGGGPDAILAAIDVLQADLVVLTVRRTHRLTAWLRSSVAERVLNRSAAAVLLVSPEQMDNGPSSIVDRPRIVVPLDGSCYAERALPLAEWFAETFGGRCVLL